MDMDPKGFPRGSYEALLDDSSQLSIALDTMAVTLGMDRALTDACKADALATHELGLSATDKLTPQLIEEMLFLARDLPPRYKELREGNVWERYENFSRSHLSRKKQRQYQKRLSNSKRLLDNHTESLESYATRERLGMFDSTTLDYIYFLDNIHYFFEPRPEEDYPLREDIVDQKDLQPLFSEDELTENVTMEQLAKKLVEMGKIDISPETLDARFGQLTKVAQIEMLYAMLDVLDNISRRGGKKKAFTMNFLETHHETTQRDDLWGMLEMMRQLANTCRQYGMAEKSSLLMSMANFMKRYADDIAYIIGQYKEAYLAFGYDLPEVIKSTPADTRPSLGRRAVAELVSIDNPTDTNEEQYRLEADEIRTSLEELIAEVLEQWRLNTKERKDQGFGLLHKSLVNGYANAAGEELVSGVPKEEAQEITDALHFLEKCGLELSPKDAVNRLGYIKGLETEINNEAESLEEFIDSHQLPTSLSLSHYPSLSKNVSSIRNNWDVYKRLVQDTWPRSRRGKVIEVIEPILFPPAAPEENIQSLSDITPPTPTELFDISAKAAMIEQLDTVLLPPNATVQEIHRELERLGQESNVTDIEWRRLLDLLAVRDRFGGVVYRSKNRSLGGAPPYYVAVIEVEGSRYAVADSPVLGNATYIVSEKHAPGSWLEMLELSREEVRELGARRIIHSKAAPHGPLHQEKIFNTLFELHVTKGIQET